MFEQESSLKRSTFFESSRYVYKRKETHTHTHTHREREREKALAFCSFHKLSLYQIVSRVIRNWRNAKKQIG